MVEDITPELVVLDAIRKQAERARRSHLVSRGSMASVSTPAFRFQLCLSPCPDSLQ